MNGGDYFQSFIKIGEQLKVNFMCADIFLWNVTTLHWSSFAKEFLRDRCHLTPKFFAKSPKGFFICTKSNVPMEI
jgi:hypothetical protein